MSVRRVLRFTLMAVFAFAFAPPATAAEPMPVAPMPRVKKQGRIEIELRFGAPHGIELRLQSDAARPGAVQAPCCEEGCRKPAAAAKLQPRGRVESGYNPADFPIADPMTPYPTLPPCPAPPRLIAGGPCPAPVAGGMVPPMACAPPVAWNPIPAPPMAVTRVVAVKAVEAGRPNPLLGTWKRDIGMFGFTVTFTPDEMTLCITQREGDAVTWILTGQYTLTNDGLVYGAITSADMDIKGNAKSKLGAELLELAPLIQQIADQPFSFRVKSTSAGLMVSQVKGGAFEGISPKDLAVLGGLYKRDEPRAVTVGFTQPRCEAGIGATLGAACGKPVAGACIGGLVGSACAKPAPCAPPVLGFDFAPAPAMPQPMPPPVCPGPLPVMAPPMPPAPCPMPQPVRPVAGSIPNDSMKQMAVEAFGEMMWERGVTRPIGGMTLPSPQYLLHYPQYLPPDPAFPLPQELASMEAPRYELPPATAPAKSGIVGTWHRDFETIRCAMKIDADHLTITVAESHEIAGAPVTSLLTFTADYHLTRDGKTAVGLITSADVKFEGKLTETELESAMESVGEIREMLEEKPVALTFHVYDNTLAVGNVRLPSTGKLFMDKLATRIGGRYTAAGDKPSKHKPVTASTQAMPRCTSSGCVPPTPVGPVLVLPTGPSVTSIPLGAPIQELPPLPGTPVLPASGTVPVMPEPTAPVPSMTTPVAPGVGIAIPALGPIGTALDFNVPLNRTPGDNRQLFNFSVGIFGGESEVQPEPRMPEPTPPGEVVTPRQSRTSTADRPLYREWRRFWFNDQPSHLTPERVHGGIY